MISLFGINPWTYNSKDDENTTPQPNCHGYHINNTTAIRDESGTFTFHFKMSCEEADQNCLAVPAGPFDVAARYYLPEPEIMSGEWTMPHPAKVETD